MTTDSSMRTESGLSLNGVTKPAPGVIPSLQGILLRSRCHLFYSVFDIKKFFRSVRISNKDSYLRIVCVPSSSFSTKPSSTPSWIYYRDRPFLSVTVHPPTITWHAARLQLCSPIYQMFLYNYRKQSVIFLANQIMCVPDLWPDCFRHYQENIRRHTSSSRQIHHWCPLWC